MKKWKENEGESDWAYLVATFHRPGRGPVRVKPRTGGGRGDDTQICKQTQTHKSGSKKCPKLILQNFRCWKRMRFLLLLLPVLARAISETTTLREERGGDELELERVKRGFYT